MTKPCLDPLHEGENDLRLSEFYCAPNYADGRMNICRVCHIRKSRVAVERTRAERQARGLTCRPTAEERARKAFAVLEASVRSSDQRSASEEQPSPIEPRGLCSLPPESESVFPSPELEDGEEEFLRTTNFLKHSVEPKPTPRWRIG